MCMMCDGASAEEFRASLHGHVERHGWALTGVEADDDTVPWAYTVGLVDGFNHPELIVVGMTWRSAARLLNDLGERVRRGDRFDGRSVPEVGDHLFTVGPVDPEQFEHETFGGWCDYYESHVREFVPRVALQVFPPGCLVPHGGDPARWRLDTPFEVLGGRVPRTERA